MRELKVPSNLILFNIVHFELDSVQAGIVKFLFLHSGGLYGILENTWLIARGLQSRGKEEFHLTDISAQDQHLLPTLL
jgi:hypothetical protein